MGAASFPGAGESEPGKKMAPVLKRQNRTGQAKTLSGLKKEKGRVKPSLKNPL